MLTDGGGGGAELRLIDALLDAAFERYRPEEGPQFGPRWNLTRLHCRRPGHSACLPDCAGGGACTFDPFVELGHWD